MSTLVPGSCEAVGLSMTESSWLELRELSAPLPVLPRGEEVWRLRGEELGEDGDDVCFTVIVIEVKELIQPQVLMIMDMIVVILVMIVTRGQADGSICQC